MTLRPIIPGGPTDRIARAGGEKLFVDLQMFLAGHPTDQVGYALIASLGALCLGAFEDLGDVDQFLKKAVDDAKNEVLLNWDERYAARERGRAIMRARQ